MKLQISFDQMQLEEAISIAQRVEPFADILEVGTLMIYRFGMPAISKFKETFPNKSVLADIKILDRGKDTIRALETFNADWFTVMAGATRPTIQGACSQAHAQKTKIMLDLIDSSSAGQSAMEAKTLGVDALLFHRPFDDSRQSEFLDRWEMVRGNSQLPIYIAAHVTHETIKPVLELKPTGIVIGSAITKAPDPAKEAEYFHELINTPL